MYKKTKRTSVYKRSNKCELRHYIIFVVFFIYFFEKTTDVCCCCFFLFSRDLLCAYMSVAEAVSQRMRWSRGGGEGNYKNISRLVVVDTEGTGCPVGWLAGGLTDGRTGEKTLILIGRGRKRERDVLCVCVCVHMEKLFIYVYKTPAPSSFLSRLSGGVSKAFFFGWLVVGEEEEKVRSGREGVEVPTWKNRPSLSSRWEGSKERRIFYL